MGIVDSQTDSELVQSANSGDEAAFEALYYRYRDWVVRLAWRFCGRQEDSLDVLQETFAYLLRKLPHLRLTASMTTFLYPVVRNLSLEMMRKRRGSLGADALEQVPMADANAGASRAELSAVLRALPEAQREVVLMRFVDGFELSEIAEALGVPVGTVKSRLHNAIVALREDPRTREYF